MYLYVYIYMATVWMEPKIRFQENRFPRRLHSKTNFSDFGLRRNFNILVRKSIEFDDWPSTRNYRRFVFFFFLFLFGFGWANNVSFNPRGFARFCFMSNRMKWIANCKLNIVGDHLWGLAKSDHNVLFIQNSITFTYGFQSLPNQVN